MIVELGPKAASKRISATEATFFIRHTRAGAPGVEYTSKTFGPGKVNLEGFVSDPESIEALSIDIVIRLLLNNIKFDFITGIHKGGVTFSPTVTALYNRHSRRLVLPTTFDPKSGELEGLARLPSEARVALLFDDVANKGTSFRAARAALVARGYEVNHAAAIVDYESPDYEGPPVISVCTLRQVIAASPFPEELKDEYLKYLAKPKIWDQNYRASRGIT